MHSMLLYSMGTYIVLCVLGGIVFFFNFLCISGVEVQLRQDGWSYAKPTKHVLNQIFTFSIMSLTQRYAPPPPPIVSLVRGVSSQCPSFASISPGSPKFTLHVSCFHMRVEYTYLAHTYIHACGVCTRAAITAKCMLHLSCSY